VLVNENVLPEQDADQRGQILDAIMLAVAGGRERTASELGALLERAGFNRANVAT
jgi:hypothetical protein